MGPQLRLEGPRTEVLRGVEALVHVAEIVGRGRLDLRGAAEDLDVAWLQRRQLLGRVELELVEELRGVAADDPEELHSSFGGELVRAREGEPPAGRHRVGGQGL